MVVSRRRLFRREHFAETDLLRSAGNSTLYGPLRVHKRSSLTSACTSSAQSAFVENADACPSSGATRSQTAGLGIWNQDLSFGINPMCRTVIVLLAGKRSSSGSIDPSDRLRSQLFDDNTKMQRTVF